MVIYAKVVATIALIVGGLGFVVPTLVSAPNYFMVLMGFALVAAVPAAIFYVWENELGKIIDRIARGDDETV